MTHEEILHQLKNCFFTPTYPIKISYKNSNEGYYVKIKFINSNFDVDQVLKNIVKAFWNNPNFQGYYPQIDRGYHDVPPGHEFTYKYSDLETYEKFLQSQNFQYDKNIHTFETKDLNEALEKLASLLAYKEVNSKYEIL